VPRNDGDIRHRDAKFCVSTTYNVQ
jgi:hypothetical protein